MTAPRDILLEALTKVRVAWQAQELAHEPEVLKPIVDALGEWEPDQEVQNHWIVSPSAFPIKLGPNEAAEVLLSRSMRETPETALEWLRALLRTTKAAASYVIPIWGLNIDWGKNTDRRVPLGRDWRLIPFEEVPAQLRSHLLSSATTNLLFPHRWMSPWNYSAPQTALIRHFDDFPYLQPEPKRDLITQLVNEVEELLGFCKAKYAANLSRGAIGSRSTIRI